MARTDEQDMTCSNFYTICMTSLPSNPAATLSTISNALGQDSIWVNVFTELQLYLEMSKDVLNATNTKPSA